MADTYDARVLNNYWTVGDTNPSTHVFSSASGSYVVLADATYVAWLAAGNVKSTIDTEANLYIVINQAALHNLPYLWGAQTLVPAPDLALTNPLLTLTVVQNAGAPHEVTLPQANMPNGMPIGEPFYIRNSPFSVSTFDLYDFNGTNLLYSALAVGDELRVIKKTNAGLYGTYDIAPSPRLPVRVPNGGTGRNTLTAHGILLGEGTSAINQTAEMSNGQLLVGQTGADPLPKTISGDVTFAASGAATIANNAVTDAKFRQGTARSVVGVTGNATANTADIQGTADQVLRINGAGTALAFGAMDLSKSAAVTGVLQAASFPALTGDVTTVAGALAATIANNAVTYAKMQDVSATSRILGRKTAGAGDPEECTLAEILAFGSITLSVSAFGPTSSGGLDFGTTAVPWANLFLKNTAQIVFNNSYTLTHSTGLLTANGAIKTTDTTAASSTSTGSGIFAGGVGVAGKGYFGGALNVTDATAASSTATGSGIFGGGVGVATKLYVGDDSWHAGDFGIGTTSRQITGKLSVLFSGALRNGLAFNDTNAGSSAGALFVTFGRNGAGIGSISNSGETAVLYNTTSDARLKDDLRKVSGARKIIDRLKVYDFRWKATGRRAVGVLAQEAKKVFAAAVYQPKAKGEPWGVDYSKFVPLLIADAQESHARIAALEKLVAKPPARNY